MQQSTRSGKRIQDLQASGSPTLRCTVRLTHTYTQLPALLVLHSGQALHSETHTHTQSHKPVLAHLQLHTGLSRHMYPHTDTKLQPQPADLVLRRGQALHKNKRHTENLSSLLAAHLALVPAQHLVDL